MAQPTWEATVPRELVHRRAVSEVFLTSLDRDDDGGFRLGAQLPPTHGYYGDHAADHTGPEQYDLPRRLHHGQQVVLLGTGASGPVGCG